MKINKKVLKYIGYWALPVFWIAGFILMANVSNWFFIMLPLGCLISNVIMDCLGLADNDPFN